MNRSGNIDENTIDSVGNDDWNASNVSATGFKGFSNNTSGNMNEDDATNNNDPADGEIAGASQELKPPRAEAKPHPPLHPLLPSHIRSLSPVQLSRSQSRNRNITQVQPRSQSRSHSRSQSRLQARSPYMRQVTGGGNSDFAAYERASQALTAQGVPQTYAPLLSQQQQQLEQQQQQQQQQLEQQEQLEQQLKHKTDSAAPPASNAAVANNNAVPDTHSVGNETACAANPTDMCADATVSGPVITNTADVATDAVALSPTATANQSFERQQQQGQEQSPLESTRLDFSSPTKPNTNDSMSASKPSTSTKRHSRTSNVAPGAALVLSSAHYNALGFAPPTPATNKLTATAAFTASGRIMTPSTNTRPDSRSAHSHSATHGQRSPAATAAAHGHSMFPPLNSAAAAATAALALRSNANTAYTNAQQPDGRASTPLDLSASFSSQGSLSARKRAHPLAALFTATALVAEYQHKYQLQQQALALTQQGQQGQQQHSARANNNGATVGAQSKNASASATSANAVTPAPAATDAAATASAPPALFPSLPTLLLHNPTLSKLLSFASRLCRAHSAAAATERVLLAPRRKVLDRERERARRVGQLRGAWAAAGAQGQGPGERLRAAAARRKRAEVAAMMRKAAEAAQHITSSSSGTAGGMSDYEQLISILYRKKEKQQQPQQQQQQKQQGGFAANSDDEDEEDKDIRKLEQELYELSSATNGRSGRGFKVKPDLPLWRVKTAAQSHQLSSANNNARTENSGRNNPYVTMTSTSDVDAATGAAHSHNAAASSKSSRPFSPSLLFTPVGEGEGEDVARMHLDGSKHSSADSSARRAGAGANEADLMRRRRLTDLDSQATTAAAATATAASASANAKQRRQRRRRRESTTSNDGNGDDDYDDDDASSGPDANDVCDSTDNDSLSDDDAGSGNGKKSRALATTEWWQLKSLTFATPQQQKQRQRKQQQAKPSDSSAQPALQQQKSLSTATSSAVAPTSASAGAQSGGPTLWLASGPKALPASLIGGSNNAFTAITLVAKASNVGHKAEADNSAVEQEQDSRVQPQVQPRSQSRSRSRSPVRQQQQLQSQSQQAPAKPSLASLSDLHQQFVSLGGSSSASAVVQPPGPSSQSHSNVNGSGRESKSSSKSSSSPQSKSKSSSKSNHPN